MKFKRPLGFLTLLALALSSSAYALTGTLVVHGPPGGGNSIPLTGCNNPSSNGGWLTQDSPIFPFLSTFVTGPVTPPLSAGSLSQATGGAPGAGQALLFTSFGGAPLGSFATLISTTLTGYDSFPASGFGGEAVMVLFVSYDGGATIGDQLLFIPASNGCFAPGMWSTCNFFTGLFSTAVAGPGNPHDPTGSGGYFTLATYIGYGPNAGAVVPLSSANNPTLGVITSGGPGVAAYLDNFILNSAGPALSGPFTTLQWDFEADCSSYSGDADLDCYCDTLNPLVANRDLCAGVSNALCIGAGDPTDCCTGAGSGSCDDQTDVDADGVGDVCDTALCPTTPASCASAATNLVKLKDNADSTRQSFTWKWKKGIASAVQADFGDPLDGSSFYSVCVYDETAGTPTLVMEASIAPGGTCAGKPCWDSTAQDKGWSYKNKDGNDFDITKVRLNSGDAGKPAVQVTGKGSVLPLPAPFSPTEFFDQDTEVTVQLHDSSTGNCWGSSFGTFKKNDGIQFSAKAP